ncbi:thiamine-phosphate pyrophosphorylase [Pedobacter insulae]|uniref:Thiamine-phosphate pyrophosphorylase n=2 Tax=Pedobacter insulae TaxID=414048 RepID=A0A1I3A0Y0_9SPHI|nr:thiamine-phosphate pyrophosphorylase [Pedobacter insulae]
MGMELLHLRKPGLEKVKYAGLLQQINAEYHSRIALHHYHELAGNFEIKRLHYPVMLRKDKSANALRKQHTGKVLSTSIHSLEEINLVQDFDYTFLGPVFDSYSKSDYPGMGIVNLQLPQKINLQIFGLGGIAAHNIINLKLLGFDGAALLGWLWNDPTKTLANFKQITCLFKENM